MAIFWIKRLILNLNLDLTAQIDFQRIYDDSVVRFEPKSNPIVIIKSQRFFDNLMTILTPKNFINTLEIIQLSDSSNDDNIFPLCMISYG